jgi:hypothetical protein
MMLLRLRDLAARFPSLGLVNDSFLGSSNDTSDYRKQAWAK